ncbi:MaoC family dehydratase [Novosphingobium lindaniclasticum]|uniref:MaoC family dehydratase n=1 Tax=Novosphingobium lindaniclasticum LE124 TaxID=1096930 RepID=T0HB44_9SPHN|nr:MaoC/PaaZ C-terminal domain-containing protein [Novosphingobium lindaniclasticum]EQB13561.1 MaoC family dehydratase [Novosphingobium lindaniclasticum LE124]
MSGPIVFATPAALMGAEGTQLGPTDWFAVDQDRVDRFAEVTGDDQWIHVDVERAKAGPFGGTIVHGYLTLSLVNMFLPQMIEVRGFSAGVNVGMDRTRFLAPVLVGSRLRARGEIVAAEEIKGAIQSTVRVTVEVEGSEKPALVIDTISRYYP